MVLLAVALVAVMPLSCSKKDVHLADYDRLQEGASTKDDVIRIYGKPKFTLRTMDGGETWSYDRDHSGDFVDRNYVFKFHFDRHGRLIEKSYFLSKWP
ncbi:MAG: outer membrane protein assembly factor BamE [Deltaproteobacteria bacterium]|nr:outer membrane protein assembly factor BamE [Deltaproteobacteria bacterium]